MRSGKSSGSNNRSPRWFRIKRNEDLPVNSLNSCPVEVWTEFGIREYVAGNNWGRAANNVTSGRLKQDSLLRVSGHAGVIKRRDLRPVGWLDAKARGPNEQNACNLLQRLARPPVHSSAVKTNFASMYRIWSSNESPKPSRPIALTVSLTYRMRTSQNSSLLAPPSARHIPAHALKQGWSCTPAWTTSLAALLREQAIRRNWSAGANGVQSERAQAAGPRMCRRGRPVRAGAGGTRALLAVRMEVGV